jgi:hypothetical protein
LSLHGVCFQLHEAFSKYLFVTAWIWLSSGKHMTIASFKIALRAYHGNWEWRRASFAPE